MLRLKCCTYGQSRVHPWKLLILILCWMCAVHGVPPTVTRPLAAHPITPFPSLKHTFQLSNIFDTHLISLSVKSYHFSVWHFLSSHLKLIFTSFTHIWGGNLDVGSDQGLKRFNFNSEWGFQYNAKKKSCLDINMNKDVVIYISF